MGQVSRSISGRPREQSNCRPTVRSVPNISSLVDRLIASRSRRSSFFATELFGEPAWDILLNLYAARLAQRRLSVSGLCGTCGTPPSTTLRWLQKLVDLALVERLEDRFDHRRTWVELTCNGLQAMDSYFLNEVSFTDSPSGHGSRRDLC